MVFNFTKVEKILFSLLRMALHGTVENDLNWKSITEEEWKSCYKLAASHGVMAVAWDGIQCIESEKVLPRSLKIAWGIAVQNYEERYEIQLQNIWYNFIYSQSSFSIYSNGIN